MTKTTKELAFDLYSKGYSIAKIAEILHKNVRTIANYKNKEWDMERANFFTQLKGDRNEVYHNFTEEMYLAIREIREDGELNAEKKAQALSKLGDSFAKMSKVAALENPKEYKYGIIKRTIELLLEELKKKGETQALKVIVEMLEKHGLNEKLSSLEL
ncbi:DUF1804 family protein [Helicobacter sp. UBA3407]|uniref:DUF1804 family protein n=1 Tax=Helicobacter sp. UBA3407 TaxID=1946588 RepID=UPI00261ED171|nr:DUF1804 family protein [Helicobacter sp. UBA3407]